MMKKQMCQTVGQMVRMGRSSWLFLGVLALLVFQNPLEGVWGPMTYLDELFGLLFFPLLLVRWLKGGRRITVPRRVWTVVWLLLAVLCTGFVGCLLHHYQPLTNALSDAYVNVKFYLAIGVSFLLFERADMRQVLREIRPWIKLITLILFGLCLLDLAFHLYPGGSRWGFRSVQLFYNAYSGLVAQVTALCALCLRLYEEEQRKILPWLGMLCFVLLCTLRFKAACVLFSVALIVWLICRRGKILRPVEWGVLGAGVAVIAAPQVLFYYYQGLQEHFARPILMLASLKLGADYFPFGTGWGTFGSHFSISPYSPVYEMYRLNEVWGLSANYSQFVSDNFWPMILGQCGVIGLVCYGAVVVLLAGAVLKLGRHNVYAYGAGLLALLYLLMASTSESAFAGPSAISFAFLLGVLFAEAQAHCPQTEVLTR